MIYKQSVSRQKYRGSALVTALFVMALTVSLAVGMWFRQRVDIQRLDTILTFDELYAYSSYVDSWASSQLQLALNNANPDEHYDALNQPWAQPMPPLEVGNVRINGQIVDMQSRFDLNNLSGIDSGLFTEEDEVESAEFTEMQQAAMSTLMMQLLTQLPIEPVILLDEAELITMELQNRVGGAQAMNNQATPGISLMPSLGAGMGTPMASITEMRLIPGITPERARTLSAYVSALPRNIFVTMALEGEGTIPINVNTAEAPVLAAALGVSVDQALTIVDQRPYVSMEAFEAVASQLIPNEGPALEIPLTSLFDVKSAFFLVRADVQTSREVITVFTLLHRINEEAVVNVIWQSRGTV